MKVFTRFNQQFFRHFKAFFGQLCLEFKWCIVVDPVSSVLERGDIHRGLFLHLDLVDQISPAEVLLFD